MEDILGNLFSENIDALFSLPAEVKMILFVALVIFIGGGIIKKAFQFLKIVVIVAVIYFGLVAAGIL